MAMPHNENDNDDKVDFVDDENENDDEKDDGHSGTWRCHE